MEVQKETGGIKEGLAMERVECAEVIGHAEQWNTSSSNLEALGVLFLEITSVLLQNVTLID